MGAGQLGLSNRVGRQRQVASSERWRALRREARQPFSPGRWWLRVALPCFCNSQRPAEQDPEQGPPPVEDSEIVKPAETRKACATLPIPIASV